MVVQVSLPALFAAHAGCEPKVFPLVTPRKRVATIAAYRIVLISMLSLIDRLYAVWMNEFWWSVCQNSHR